jgi:hypothetical protein
VNDDERIERALKSIGDSYIKDNPANFPAFREGVMRRQRRRRWFQAGSAVALAGATVAIGLFFARSAPLDRSDPIPPAGGDVTEAITDSVIVGDIPSQVNVGRKAIWVTSKSGSVTRIDAATKETVTRDLGGLPTDLAVGGSGVWVANDGRLQRVPLTGTGAIDSFGITQSSARMHVSVAPGAVWVVVPGEQVYRVDAKNGEPTAFDAGASPADIAVADGVLWALDLAGRIQGYDVRTGEPVGDAIDVPTGDDAEITLGSGALWYGVKADTTFMRIDLETGGQRTITLPSNYVDMGVGQSEVWVLMAGGDDTGSFAAADPATGRLVGDMHSIEGAPVDVAVGRQALWIINATGNRALRVQKDLLED